MRNAERVAKLVQEVELKQAGLLRSAEIHHEKERFAPFPLHKPALQPRAPSPNFECSDDDAYWPVQAAAPRSLPSEAPLQHFNANMPTKGALQAEAAALRLTTASVGPPIAREAERAHAEAEQTRATTNHRMLPRPSPASSETLMTHAVDAGGAAPDLRPDRSSPRSTLQRLRTPNRSACKPPPPPPPPPLRSAARRVRCSATVAFVPLSGATPLAAAEARKQPCAACGTALRRTQRSEAHAGAAAMNYMEPNRTVVDAVRAAMMVGAPRRVDRIFSEEPMRQVRQSRPS